MRTLKRMITKCIKFVYSLIYKLIPINENLVIFVSFHGRG